MPRLLLIDDEPTLLQLLRRSWNVRATAWTSRETAENALSAFERDPRRYDVVITDLTLPGMNGAELLERMRASVPRFPLSFLSGYPYEPQLTGVAFLQKPFLPQMLAEAIAKLLQD